MSPAHHWCLQGVSMSVCSSLCRVVLPATFIFLNYAFEVTAQVEPDPQSIALVHKPTFYNAQTPSTGVTELPMGEYEQLVAKDPHDMIATNNLGALYFKDGRQEEGLDLIKKAADAVPEVWNFQLNASVGYTQMKQFDEALTYAKRAMTAGPEVFKVRQQLCEVYLANKMPEAVRCFEEISSDKRSEPLDLVGYGEALIMTRDLVLAEDVISRAIQRLPNCAMAHNDLAIVAFHRKQFSDAVRSLREAVRLDPDNGQIRYNLAIAQMATHNRAGAVSEYGLLKTTDPKLAERLYKVLFAGQVVFAGQ